MKKLVSILIVAMALSACGVKSQLSKPGDKAPQKSEEHDPSLPPAPLGK